MNTAMSAMGQTKTQAHWIEAQAYQALANPTRLEILYTLAEGSRNVGELADTLGLPISCISRHLRVLRETMLVNAHHFGPTITYRVSDQRITQVIELLRLASAHPTRFVKVAAQECENIPGAHR